MRTKEMLKKLGITFATIFLVGISTISPVVADGIEPQVYGTNCIQRVNGTYGITSIDNCNLQAGAVESEIMILATAVFGIAVSMVIVGRFVDPDKYLATLS